MVTEDKARALTAFLGKLPENIAVRLARAVEYDRLADGKNLPHGLILDALRPILRKAQGQQRTQTPLRLFCLPFEDLLTSAPRKDKLIGSISIASIMPVWNWLAESVIPGPLAEYEAGAKSDILGFRNDNAKARAEAFWPVASAAMLEALSTPAGTKAAKTALGSDAAVADAREMALLLAVGPQMLDLQRKLPSGTPELGEELLWTLRGVYQSVLDASPDSAPFVAVVVMNRLERPWEAMRLALAISRQTQDTLISNTDMGLVGEILFAEIETHAVAIRAARQPDFDADDLVNHVAAFATLSLGMVKEVEMRRDGRWGQRLLKDRAALAEVMDGFMKRAPREMLGALPTQKTGNYAGGPRVPDISKPIDSQKFYRALRYGRLIAGCRSFAAAACFGASLQDAQTEVAVGLRSYTEDMLRELRAAEGDRRKNAEEMFSLAVDMLSLMTSPEEAEFLRRRGRAALGTQAAA